MQHSSWTAFVEFLSFRRMASPILLQILFWAGIAGSFYGTYVLIQLENKAWPFPLIFGPLIVRVIFERAIIAFRTYDRLSEIQKVLVKSGGVKS